MNQHDPVGVEFLAVEDAVGTKGVSCCVMLGAGDGAKRQEDQ
jgi:hypothetical protein